jgi:hypothetical protein
LAETIEEKIAKIEATESAIIKQCEQWMRVGDDLYISDFILVGVVKRTLALADGFRTHIAARNFTCAAALVRMQLDTAMRVFAARLVSDSEAYAKAVFHGERVDKLKDRHGKRLTDSYLVKRLNERHPWVEGVYRDASGLIHFSNRHIFASIAKLSEADRTVHYLVSAKDPPRPDEDYFEVIEAYFESMKLTMGLAHGWQSTKKDWRSRSSD